jgi:hypothetical protein
VFQEGTSVLGTRIADRDLFLLEDRRGAHYPLAEGHHRLVERTHHHVAREEPRNPHIDASEPDLSSGTGGGPPSKTRVVAGALALAAPLLLTSLLLLRRRANPRVSGL